jgi:hypothetical protein
MIRGHDAKREGIPLREGRQETEDASAVMNHRGRGWFQTHEWHECWILNGLIRVVESTIKMQVKIANVCGQAVYSM